MSIVFDVALAHLTTRRRQSAVSIVGVVLGVGFFIGASSMLQGSQNDLIERMVDSAPHITVKDEYRLAPPQPVTQLFAGAAVDLRGAKPRETVRGIKDPPGTVAEIERMGGVTVAPALVGQVIMRYGSKDRAASIAGIDVDREPKVSKLASDMEFGQIGDLETAANGVIVGAQLLENLGAGRGDTLSVISPAGVVMKMKVVGVFRTGVAAIDRATAYTLLKKAQVLLDRPNVVNQLRLRLDDFNQARGLAAEIEARYRYRAESWQEANEDLLALLQIRNTILYSIVTAILVVANFGIYNIIATIVYEKIRDIAILKSMGFAARDIHRIFLLQGIVVGALGSLIGWALGFAIVRGMGAIPLHVAGLVDIEHIPMDRSFIHYVVAGGFAVLAATLAAYLPARKAAALRPVDILRGAA